MALLKATRLVGQEPRSHGGVVAQVWQGGPGRRALSARLLAGVDVEALDAWVGRTAGALLGATGTDVVDAALVAMTFDGDVVLTSDPHDLTGLARASGTHLEIVAV